MTYESSGGSEGDHALLSFPWVVHEHLLVVASGAREQTGEAVVGATGRGQEEVELEGNGSVGQISDSAWLDERSGLGWREEDASVATCEGACGADMELCCEAQCADFTKVSHWLCAGCFNTKSMAQEYSSGATTPPVCGVCIEAS